MANEARQHRFKAAAQREGDQFTLILGGLIWPDNENASAQIAQQLMQLQEGDKLTVILRNLYGGDCDEGMSIYHDLVAHKPRVVVDGVVASMGTVIMLAGEQVECTEHSKGMTHRPTGHTSGDFEDMRDRADQNEAIYKEAGAIYAARMGKPIQEVMDLLMPKGRDMWWSAKQMKEMGLVQQVTKGSALRSTVAMRDLRKERDPSAILSRFAACLSEDEVQLTDDQTNMKETAKKLGLPETASEAEVNAAIDKLMREKDKAVADLSTLQDAEAKRQEDELKGILDDAVKGNRMTASDRDQMMNDAKGNLAGVLSAARVMVKGMKPHVDASRLIRNGADQAAGGQDKYAGYSYKDYLEKAPEALAAMKRNDMASFTKLKEDYLQSRRNG